MIQTYEIGPRIGMVAPDFTARDHTEKPRCLNALIGVKGLLLGFIGGVWLPTNIRRILWLERHARTYIRMGYNVALLIRDEPHMLYGFYVSSPTPLEFPLLSDVDGQIHRHFSLEKHPGMVLLDEQRVVRHKWLLPDERVWPRTQEILDVLNHPRHQA